MINRAVKPNIYSTVESLIGELEEIHQGQLAKILYHRLHKVAWTSRGELLIELRKVLSGAIEFGGKNIPPATVDNIEAILLMIDEDVEAAGL